MRPLSIYVWYYIFMRLFRKTVNLKYSDNLFLSPGIDEAKLPKLQKKIEKGKGKVVLLLRSEDKDDLIDIVTPFQLTFRIWEDKEPVVLGLADDNDEAYELVQTILREGLAESGKSLKEYICSL